MARSLLLPTPKMLTATALLLLGILALQDRPPAVSVRLDPAGEPFFLRHTPVKVSIRTDRGAYVTVFRADTEGRLSVLYPEHPWEDNYLHPGRSYPISTARAEHSFTVESEPGIGYLFAIASPEPFSYRKVAREERWDYAFLVPEGRITGDPYGAFMTVAEQILQGGGTVFGSALLAYHVAGPYDYPRFVCYDCHAPPTQPAWDPYQRTCSRFALVRHSDPEAGYRYGFRDLRLAPEESPQDWVSRVLNLKRLIPWISQPGPASRQLERATESEVSPSPLLRNLTPSLERRLTPASLERPDSPPLRHPRRRRPPR